MALQFEYGKRSTKEGKNWICQGKSCGHMNKARKGLCSTFPSLNVVTVGDQYVTISILLCTSLVYFSNPR